MTIENSWIKLRSCAMTLCICTTSLAMNVALAGAKEIADPIRVINDDGDSLSVTIDNANVPVSGDIGITGEVEVKNDSGDPLPVSGNVIVTNNSPVDVTVRPGNASYTKRFTSPTVVEFSPFTTNSTISTASHMRGLTVSAHAFGNVEYCEFVLSYPNDAAQRPFNQSNPEIVRLFLAAPVDTQHIPLPDLFVGTDVDLTYSFSTHAGGTGGDCVTTTTLHLRPLPVPIVP